MWKPPTEQKESVNTPQKKVPFQFMFQDKNKTNVFANPYKCEYFDKEFDKKNLNRKNTLIMIKYIAYCVKRFTQHSMGKEPSYQNNMVKKMTSSLS